MYHAKTRLANGLRSAVNALKGFSSSSSCSLSSSLLLFGLTQRGEYNNGGVGRAKASNLEVEYDNRERH